MLIAPSILNIDNLKLSESIKIAAKAGITRFHIDIMDGHFVPNLSFGPQLVADFKRDFPQLEAEVHLMSNNPDDMVPAFVKEGADVMLLHYESMPEDKLNYWLDYLKHHQVKTGMVLNPDTPIEVLTKYMSMLDQVLLMTVYPGFGGQKFIPESTQRINQAVNLLQNKIPVEVDGGINAETAKIARKAGASIFVAGSYIFCQNNIAGQINELNGVLR
ncbi:ribulose-phosphate 3-epimerase [Lactobacillus sp. ESL0228]|uniref:ribulose-phosphate 3-epimerase n=1 Tax=Lactobacillus sp. ESL0228 TaxID=2069352 RepID=UPI000EFBD2FC|nr:ribulose-phosphate 3-epimerase [Lactobacillus sp. ESL0228]RMC49005.1 ribulose-phosphate 3-epimerase [Lactobacillus sp. ESL0228]